MNLDLFRNLKNNIEQNNNVKNFIEELGDFLKRATSKTEQIENEEIETNLEKINNSIDRQDSILEEESRKEYRKENHLYLVTEDRNGKVYLWDYTDKPKYEIEETDLPEELLSVAKEGAMLKYINGQYELYSKRGYNILFQEENNEE